MANDSCGLCHGEKRRDRNNKLDELKLMASPIYGHVGFEGSTALGDGGVTGPLMSFESSALSTKVVLSFIQAIGT
jgi:hypothetical protein